MPVISAKPAGELGVGADGRNADHVRAPANAGRDQKAVFTGVVLENLAKLGFKTFGYQFRRLVEQFGQLRTLQRRHAKLGQDFLLAKPQTESAFV